MVILVERKTKTERKFDESQSIQLLPVNSENTIPFQVEQVILPQTSEQTILKTLNILSIYNLIMISWAKLLIPPTLG